MHATLQRAAAAHGLRFGPDPSTHTRCTIGGMIGNNACGSRALGYGRTADNVARPRRADRVRGAAPARRASGRLPAARRAGRPGGAHLRTVRTEFGRFTRQVSGYSLEHLLPENGRDVAQFLVGSEGTLGGGARRDRPAGRGRPAPGAGRARLPVDVRGRRRRAGAAARTRWWPARAWTRGSSTWCAASRRGRSRRCRGGAGWLFAEVTGDTPVEVAAPAARRRPRRRRGRRTRGHRRRGDGRAVADPRGRRRARRPDAWSGRRTVRLGGRRGAARSGSATTCAGSTRCCASRARRRALRPLRRRLRARPHRLPARASAAAARGFRPFVEAAADLTARARRHACPASTATAGPARSC